MKFCKSMQQIFSHLFGYNLFMAILIVICSFLWSAQISFSAETKETLQANEMRNLSDYATNARRYRRSSNNEQQLQTPATQPHQNKVPSARYFQDDAHRLQIQTKSQLNLHEQAKLRQQLDALKLEINRDRDIAAQTQQQLTKKRQELAVTRNPRIREQIQLDINKTQQHLSLLQNKIKQSEQKLQVMMMKITNSAGFSDDSEHLSSVGGSFNTPGQAGYPGGHQQYPNGWNDPVRKSDCFIATAAYGSPLAEEVLALKNIRDGYLAHSPLGRKFIEFYYAFSPPIAEIIAQNESLRLLTRTMLWPVLVAVKHFAYFLFGLCCLIIAYVFLKRPMLDITKV